MSRIGNYIKESYKELTKKVSCPTRAQLQSSAAVVMVATFIVAVLVFVMDFAFKNLMTGIYRLLQ